MALHCQMVVANVRVIKTIAGDIILATDYNKSVHTSLSESFHAI